MAHVLFVRIESDVEPEELEKRALERRPRFREVPGLVQKIYGRDESDAFCGIYFFESREALEAYRESELPSTIPSAYEATALRPQAYAVLYPTLGNSKGALGWTQIKQWEQMQAEQEKQAQVILAKFADRDPDDLADDEQAVAIGRNLFANNCAACHGSDGRGGSGFPNLTDGDWLWSGEPELIQTSIAYGRMGVMAAWAEVLGDQGLDDAAAYVMSLSGRKAPKGDVAAGQQHFANFCAACHGADAKGMTAIGAPNLTDNIWLHGGSMEAIRYTIANGRQNVMPAQEHLGDTRIRLLAAYVISMGATRVAQVEP